MGQLGYERECTVEEAAVLQADAAAAKARHLARREAERDAWFHMLSEGDDAQPEEAHQVTDA